MAKVIDLAKGLTFYTDSTKSVFFKEFKKNLSLLSVAFNDACCPSTIAPLNLTINKAIIENRVAVPANVTQTLTASPLSNGLITSTSAAATNLTLPTATLLAAQLGAGIGTTFDFIIDNSIGASIVTLALGTGIILPPTVVITGSNILTIAATSVGIFKLYFTSTTTAIIFRTS